MNKLAKIGFIMEISGAAYLTVTSILQSKKLKKTKIELAEAKLMLSLKDVEIENLKAISDFHWYLFEKERSKNEVKEA